MTVGGFGDRLKNYEKATTKEIFARRDQIMMFSDIKTSAFMDFVMSVLIRIYLKKNICINNEPVIGNFNYFYNCLDFALV